MAGINASASQDNVTASTTVLTAIQIVAPTNQRVLIKRISVALEAATFTRIAVVKQSDAGTMTSLTPVRLSAGSETLQTTAQHTSTASPTTSSTLLREITSDRWEYAGIPDDYIVLAGGERLGITLQTLSGSVDADVTVVFEE